ncbi:DUF2207 domain-containing protein [Bifidobacterium leontopitheci]|uniref:DUF2207 domain-containing protein n=1 Tax=Bifidobacterium leontopitheci TaxID=2650774 RepID=A0A6I1GNL1_9BIFI|nr:DUF2207 domain-containing protein [Bifidobacterium leontopitheci]KAB7791126.1 hypothetical protein F7D09_0292 [Bifidobacterium leontopitheci]
MGRSGRRKLAHKIDRMSFGESAAAAFAIILAVGAVAFALWAIVSLAGSAFMERFFPEGPDRTIEQVNITARLRANGDLDVTQRMRLDLRQPQDVVVIALPLSSAAEDQLKERGVTGTGLTVTSIRNETAATSYERREYDETDDTNGTYVLDPITRTAAIYGPQQPGRSDWTVTYTLDDNALTWSDAGELIWRYGSALPDQPIPSMHVTLTFDGSNGGTQAIPGRNFSAQSAEDYRAVTTINAGKDASHGDGAVAIAIDTGLDGGRTGTLHVVFPRDWIADSPMPEPNSGVARMQRAIAMDADNTTQLGRARIKAAVTAVLWRLPLAAALAFLLIAAFLRIRRARQARPTFRDRYSSEPVLADRPWLLAALMGESHRPRAFTAALMKATMDGDIIIVDPKHGFPAARVYPGMPSGRHLHYDGALVHDPASPKLPQAAITALFGCDDVRYEPAMTTRPDATADGDEGAQIFSGGRGNRSRRVGKQDDSMPAFRVPARDHGFDASDAAMLRWRTGDPLLCATLTQAAGEASSQAIAATGWVASRGVLGKVLGVLLGVALPVAALYARLHTDDWIGFTVTITAALAGAMLSFGLRAWRGEGVDLHARGVAVRRWFDERRWRNGDDADDVGRRFTADQARGLLIDAVALGFDGNRIEEFARYAIRCDVFDGYDPVVWWCLRNGRKCIPADAMTATYKLNRDCNMDTSGIVMA